ncbi:MBOAT7 [Cordylochernes scorpioides]|uniref:Lysophospholipid acyltransferase 7 n=1 Tax=Cordylochernes scorpioides TaxID=51811 RepID=A0ABY6LHH1_9ARAC|nr:MBOAT7 [Cordylochernes scorpioides]
MLQDDLVYASLLGASIALGPYTQRISDFRQRQLVLTALGFILVVSVSGWHVFHPLVLVGANIALSQTRIYFRYYYISSFAFSFFYLFLTRTAAWWGLPSPPAHTNAVLMILVLKVITLETSICVLVGLSWEVHESESKNPPSFVNYFHYSFCLPGVLTGTEHFSCWAVWLLGPYFKYSTYKAMLQAPYLHHVPWRAHLQERLLPVPLYLILFLAASYLWPLEHPTRQNGVFQRISSPDQLSELTVWDRLFYMTPVFFAFRMRLYMGFVLGECSCIASKLGAFPEVSKPEAGRGPADLEALTHLVTSARVDRRILRQAVAAPQATCTAILQHVQDTLDHSISTRTISRRLVANGLHSCRPLRRLPLTPPNRRQRLEWCRARSTWMTEWHRIVFSDESRFCLSSDSRRVRVWRRRGERSNPAAIVERPTVRQRGIMVWGAIAYDSRSPLLRIQGTMTAHRYVDDVLRPVTLPYLQGVPNALYQQDNARPHTARISQQALQDVQMLPWPPYSPDLSPIEHVWDIIGRRLHALPQPRSEDELWQMVEREWRAIPQDAIHDVMCDSKSHPELWTSARYNFEAVRNIDEWGSEALPTIQGGIRSWNRTVQYWLASLVYRPLQPYCSKALRLSTFLSRMWLFRTLVTMLVSSFWHGVYPGYYLCLLSAPFFLLVEAKVLRAFGHLAAFRFFWWVFKMQAFAYMGMAFLLLHLTPTLQYWLSIGFVGHLLLPIFYLAACLART